MVPRPSRAGSSRLCWVGAPRGSRGSDLEEVVTVLPALHMQAEMGGDRILVEELRQSWGSKMWGRAPSDEL